MGLLKESTFTPGPLEASFNSLEVWKGGEVIADCLPPRLEQPGYQNNLPLEERQANARLFAGAPDLFEVVSETLKTIVDSPQAPNGGALWALPIALETRLRDALAKATGGQS